MHLSVSSPEFALVQLVWSPRVVVVKVPDTLLQRTGGIKGGVVMNAGAP
jgi:hypothetical protein